jgi:hypothetical protein
MTDTLAQVVVWLNAAANALGEWLLAPVAVLPGWLSATLIAVLTGLLLLVAFKYTSHQRAIQAVRSDIKAHLLALKLFRDSTGVTLRAQGRILRGAFFLMVLAIVPMLVMTVPVLLLLGQLSLWYQARPLPVGQEAVVTVKLNDNSGTSWPRVTMQPREGLKATVGPVRVLSERELCWNVKAEQNGYQHLVFQVDGQEVDKEIAVGDGFMRVSMMRPGWSWWDALLNPAEPPLRPDSPIQAIEINYPNERSSYTSGSDWWWKYWFAVSLLSAFCWRRVVRVNV